ncbi:TolC family protein [Desulfococcaceae bacterium HSG7]|nr:TolC family protein [Desulfococcaceae bacterium HSG7]
MSLPLPRRILFLLIIVVLTGCEKMIDFRQQRLQNAQIHISQIRNRTVPNDEMHTLQWCIKMALTQNLDLKAAELQQAILDERKTAAVMGMLPDLNLNYRTGSRDNEPGSRSESITTGIQTLEPSKSSEMDETRYSMELMFGILDFGLSYYSSIQESDKALQEEKQRRRTAQNLMLDVAKAYFRVASFQYEMSTIKDLIERSEEAEALIGQLLASKRIGPLKALTKIKALKKLKQQLKKHRRSYENACIELSSLMGFAPVNELSVDTAVLKKLNIIAVPEIEVLEQIALDERPELFQLDIESHITAVEARKSMLMMFPNVRLFANFTDSSNQFLYNQSWWDIALGSVYNLLKLPSEIYNYNALEIQLKEIATRTMALSIGIMAQVRIAHANLIEVKSRYELAEELFNLDQQRLEAARPRAQAGGSLSSLDLLKYELETAETFFERTQSLSNYYLAYYRLLNAVGLESLDEPVLNRARRILPEMEAAQFVKAEPVSNQQDTAFSFMIDDINHDIPSDNKAMPPRSLESPSEEEEIEIPVSNQQDTAFGFMLDGINHDIPSDNKAMPPRSLESPSEETAEKPITSENQSLTYTEPSVSPQPTSSFDFMLDNIKKNNSGGTQAQSAQLPPSPSKEIAKEDITPEKQTEEPSPGFDDAVEPLYYNEQEKNKPASSNAPPSYTSPAFQLMLDQIVKGSED